MSVRELLGQLAAIGETVLLYPSTGGRPRARRMTTELTADQPERSTSLRAQPHSSPRSMASRMTTSAAAPTTPDERTGDRMDLQAAEPLAQAGPGHR
jgi:hypothetical protein